MRKNKLIEFANIHHKKIIFALFIFYFIYIISSFFHLQAKPPYFETHCLGHPIVQDDYALHYASGIESSLFFEKKQRFWGYSPFYSAGYLSGIFYTISNRWAILFNLTLGNLLNPGLTFNMAIFFAFLILPILAFYTGRNYELKKINLLYFFASSIFLIVGFYKLRAFIFFGMYGFLLAIFLSFYTSSLFYKYIVHKKNLDLVLLSIFGSLTFFVHPFSLILCSILCVPTVFFYFKKFHIKDFFKFILCSAAILLTNLVWLIPLIRLSASVKTQPFSQTNITLVVRTLQRRSEFTVLFILFLYFLYKTIKTKNMFAISLSTSYGFFFAISFFGSQLGITILQPERFTVPLALLTALAVSTLVRDELEKRNSLFILINIILLITLLHRPQRLQCGYYENPEASAILNFIKENTSGDARLHIQDSSDQHPYFGSHFTAYIPVETSRESMAAPYNHPPPLMQFTQFTDDTLFGKNLNEISDGALRDYLELYNIKYFLVFNDSGKAFFDKNPDFKCVFEYGNFSIYDYLDSDQSYCYRCEADVKADYDTIEVKNATSNTTILKYHYIDTLKIEPASITMKPIRILDDPNPFILVENGDHSEFRIYN